MEQSLEARHPGWVSLKTSISFCEEEDVHQMMPVVGEEGIALSDLVTYIKAEIVDAVCLQQDSSTLWIGPHFGAPGG